MAVFVFAQNVGSICMKNILKNTKNIENYTKQPIAQIKKEYAWNCEKCAKKKAKYIKIIH